MVGSDNDKEEFEDIDNPFGDMEPEANVPAQEKKLEDGQASSGLEADEFDSELADLESTDFDDPFMDDFDDGLEDDFSSDYGADEFAASGDDYQADDFVSDYGSDDFADEGGFDDGSGGGVPPKGKFDAKDFLKNNFQYIAYGAVGIVGVYMIVTTLFPGGPAQDAGNYQQPSMQQQAMNDGGAVQPFGNSSNTAPVNNTDQSGSNEPAGLLLGGSMNTSNTASNNQQAGLLGSQSQGKQPSFGEEASTTSGQMGSSKTWQQPPMPTPISKDNDVPASQVKEFSARSQSSNSAPAIPDTTPDKEIMATGATSKALTPSSNTGRLLSRNTPSSEPAVETRSEETTPMFAANKSQPNDTEVVSLDNRTSQQEPMSSETRGELEAEIKSLNSELEKVTTDYKVLKASFDRLNTKVTRMQSNANAGNSDNASTEMLENTIKRLETRLNQLEKEKSASTRSIQPSARTSSSSSSSATRSAPKTVVRHAPTTVSSLPKEKPMQAASSVNRGVRPSSSYGVTIADAQNDLSFKSEEGWVLRAAQPGVAWISRGYEAPIRKIFAGQILKDVGTVQSIRLENGRWIVRGNQGQITQ